MAGTELWFRLSRAIDVLGESGVADWLKVEVSELDDVGHGRIVVDPALIRKAEEMAGFEPDEPLGDYQEEGPDGGEFLPDHLALPDLSGVELSSPVWSGEEPGFVPQEAVTRSVDFRDEQEMRRISLRRAREMAMMTQFRIGMEYHEKVEAIGMVARIEMVLIYCFQESVPNPGARWDDDRRNREVEKRLARIRWVERELAHEFTGIRGVLNWLAGKTRLTGKDLYRKMVIEADEIMESAAEATRARRQRRELTGDDRTSGIAALTGMEYLMGDPDKIRGEIVEGRPGSQGGLPGGKGDSGLDAAAMPLDDEEYL